MPPAGSPRVIGRYALYDELAAGGMATVRYGRLLGSAGFSRVVVVKRLHPKHARDPRFRAMLLDEARLAARIRHRNVVPTLDVVWEQGELFVVLEYAHGETLSRLLRATSEAGGTVDWRVVGSVLSDVLHGLHAAHDAKSERGEPLGLVHRDVSPQNVVVCTDGIARVLDFGIAKAAGRLFETQAGVIKGKLPYMPPEQLRGEVSRRTDVFAAAVVLWEALTARRLFTGESDAEIMATVAALPVEPPSRIVPGLPPAIDAVVLKGLERDPARRFETAREMALALEACGPFAPPSEVGAWVERVAGAALAARSRLIEGIEGSPLPPSDTLSEMLGVAAPPGLEETAPPTARESPRARPERRPRSPVALPLAGGLALVLGAAATWVALRPQLGAAGASASSAPPAAPAVAGSQSADPPAVAPLDEAPPASASASAPPALPPPHASTRPTAPWPPARARASATPSACDPPYSVDAEGHKHFKTECL
jgi:serine/threonine-protein kinase